MTDFTKKIRKTKNIFLILQLVIMLGVTVFLVSRTIGCFGTPNPDATFSELYGTVLTSLCLTVGILCALLIVIGHKVRNTIWMVNLLISAYLYGTTGMWIIFAIWVVDEYVIYPIYNHKKTQLTASKIYDKREGA